FAKSIPIVDGKRHWWASPQRLGAGAAIDAAVSNALGARPRQRLRLHVAVGEQRVRRFVDHVARAVDTSAVDAELTGLTSAGEPAISDGREGIAVRRDLVRRELELELRTGRRTPIALPTQP